MTLLALAACHGPLVIPYSPPTTGAVSDAQLKQGELELRSEGGYPELISRQLDKPLYVNQPFGPSWVHGGGVGLTERVDLRLDAGPRYQGPGFGGELGVLLYRRDRVDLGATAGTWLTVAEDTHISPTGPSGNNIEYDYGYWAWAPTLGHRGTWRMDEVVHLHWRLRGSRAFTRGWYNLAPGDDRSRWWVEHAASLSVGPKAGWLRVGVGTSVLTDGRSPVWWPGLNVGLALRVPTEELRK